MMSTSMTAAAAAAVTPRLQARMADARSPARLTSSRRRPPTTRAGATSGDEDGGRIEKEGQSKIRNIQMEKASALREELEGIRGRARRLLSRGSRLVERGAELKAAAERAMIREVDRDEDEARRLLTERKKIRDTLDLTMARAEVLQELANKIGAAIIVLEHDTNYDDDDNDRSSPSSAAPFTASPSNAQPVKTMSEESLEREFAKLEINQLERMLQLSDTPGEDQQVGGGGGRGISEAAKPTPAPGAAKICPSDAEPAWWRPPTPCSAPESEEDGEAAARAAAGGVMTPLEALLEVDRARVSTAGVQGHHVVALRVSCAAWGARGVAASDRLVGGKRDTAFRAGVAEAIAAVETAQTAQSPRENIADGVGEPPRWATLGGFPPDLFLSDLARDLGMSPERAGNLVASATARRAANRLLQAGAFMRACHREEAAAEVAALAAVLAALITGENSGAAHNLELVALRLEQQLSEEERRVVLGLTAPEVSPEVSGVIQRALGL